MNREYIKKRLFRLEPIGINSIVYQNDPNFIDLEIFNKNKLPINIESLILQKKAYKPVSGKILSGESSYRRIPIQKIKFKKIKDLTDEKFINFENQNINNSYLKDVILNYKIDGHLQDEINKNQRGKFTD